MTDRPDLEPIFAEAIAAAVAAAELDEPQVLRDIAALAEEDPRPSK